MPGQWMVLPEGVGASRPMPLPRVGLPEDFAASYYAQTPRRLRSPATACIATARPRSATVHQELDITPTVTIRHG